MTAKIAAVFLLMSSLVWPHAANSQGLAQQDQHPASEAGSGLDHMRNVAARVIFLIDIFKINAAMFLMLLEIVIGAIGNAFKFAETGRGEGITVFDIGRRF